jgi:methylated-DNA-[protein]-cysteine S-methyltransferase
MNRFFYSVFPAAGGYAALIADDNGIVEFKLPVANNDDAVNSIAAKRKGAVEADTATIKTARELLKSYFKGLTVDFKKVRVSLAGLSVFTEKILKAAAGIPYGETRTYKWAAEQAGQRDAARAAGNALNRNPIPVIIPCHRVILSGGELGGFSSGIEWKLKLLKLEKILK